MELVSPINLNISKKLKNKSYFHRFFFIRTKAEIAEQIRSLRTKRVLKQAELAQLADMKQSAISRIEQSDYAGWSFKTLLRIANALDARLQVTFTPAEDVVKDYEERERLLSDRGKGKEMVGFVRSEDKQREFNERRRSAENIQRWVLRGMQAIENHGEPDPIELAKSRSLHAEIQHITLSTALGVKGSGITGHSQESGSSFHTGL